MSIQLRAARHCDRCDKHLKDVEGDPQTAIKADEARKPVFAVRHGEKVTEYRDLCPKCDKRLGDLYMAVTLDKEPELPPAPAIDTSKNSLLDEGVKLPVEAPAPAPAEEKVAPTWKPPEEVPPEEEYDRPLPGAVG